MFQRNPHCFTFVCDASLFSPEKNRSYSFVSRSFSDALFELEKTLTSSYKEKVTFATLFITDVHFKYVIVKEDGKIDGNPVTVEVYEE